MSTSEKKLSPIIVLIVAISFSLASQIFAANETDADIDKANSYDDAWELGPKGWVVTMQKRHKDFTGEPGALIINGDSNHDRAPGWSWMNMDSTTPTYWTGASHANLPVGQGKTAEDEAICNYIHMDEWYDHANIDQVRENSYNAVELAVLGIQSQTDTYALTSGGIRLTAANGTTYSMWLAGRDGTLGSGLMLSYEEAYSAFAADRPASTTPRDGGRKLTDFELMYINLGTNDLRGSRPPNQYGGDLATALTKILDPANHIIPMVSSPSRTFTAYDNFKNGIPMLGDVCEMVGLPYVGTDEEFMRRATAWECWESGEYGYANRLPDTLHYSGVMESDYYADPYASGGQKLSESYALLRTWLLVQKIKEVKEKVIDAPETTPADVSLSVGATTHNNVALSWTGGSNAAYFELQRRKSGGRWRLVSQTIAPDATSYNDKNQTTGGVAYEYRLRGVNGYGIGNWNTASTTLPAAPSVSSIAFDEDTGSAAVNGLHTFEVVATFSDGSKSIVNDGVNLSFDDGSIAESLSAGSATVTGKLAGATSVTANYAGETAVGTIRVTATEDVTVGHDAYCGKEENTGDPAYWYQHGEKDVLLIRNTSNRGYMGVIYLKFDLASISRDDFSNATLKITEKDTYTPAYTIGVCGLNGDSYNLLDRWDERFISSRYNGGRLRMGASSGSDSNPSGDDGSGIANATDLGNFSADTAGERSFSSAAMNTYLAGSYGLSEGYDDDVTICLWGESGSSSEYIEFISKEGGTPAKLCFEYPAVPGDISTLSTAAAYECADELDLTVPPTLTADSTGNNVDNDIVVTFTDADGWAAAINEVSVDSVVLTEGTDYTVNGAGGELTLNASSAAANAAIHASGSWALVVKADGFINAMLSQTVEPGAITTVNTTVSDPAPEFTAGAASTITITAKDQYDNGISGYSFKYDATIMDNDATTDESYTIDGNATSSNSSDVVLSSNTAADGTVTLPVTIPATVDPDDGFKLQIQLADGTTNVGMSIVFGGKTPPTLTADSTANNVDNDIVVTFTDADGWAAGIEQVSVNGVILTSIQDYTVDGPAGELSLLASSGAANAAIHAAGAWSVVVASDGFSDAIVSQDVAVGAISVANSTITDDVILVRELTMDVTAVAKDQYDNPIENYVFKYDAVVTDDDPGYDESYAVEGTPVAVSANDVALTPTDANGQVVFGIFVPEHVDYNDGVSIQTQLNDGTTDFGDSIDYTEIEGRKLLTYNPETFTEDAAANDGSIGNSITITLQNTSFTADAVSGNHVSAINVPSGLSASFVRDSDTQITFSLSGQADSHTDGDDVSNLTVTFDDDAFSGTTATYVGESTKSDLSVDFSTSGALVWLRLDESSGATAANSGSSVDGTLEGDPSWSPSGGKIAGALDFDGTGDYVNLGQPAELDFTPTDDDFTVSCWFKTSASGALIAKVDTYNTSVQYYLYVGSGGELVAKSGGDNGIGSSVVNDGAWHMATVVNDASTDTFTLYLDGAFNASGTSLGQGANSRDLLIGGRRDGDNTSLGFPYTGLIDDVRIYPTAMSATNVENLYDAAENIPALSYSDDSFSESIVNDGSIDNSTPIIITLTNDSFAGSNDDDFVSDGKIVVTNMPAGLTAVATRMGATELSVTITGNASNHADTDDVANLTFTFQDAAFTTNSAADVTDYNKSDLVIDFADEPGNADYTVGASGADYTTIAAAIAACSGGEVIEVIDAVHTEDAVTVDKNNLTIQGQGMDSTVVQAGTSLAAADDRVFLISSTISHATIKDMTLRYGDRSSNGGAIYSSTDLTLENCRITDCRASAAGGAISMGYKDDLLIGKSLTITNSVIENCESTSTDSAEGGGALFANTTGAVIIVDSTLADNTAASRGGAVRGNCDMTVTGCAVTGNTAGYYGGGFYLNDATHKVIENCTVSGNAANDATYGGGGLYITGTNSTTEIYNSTIAANSAAGDGGGLYISTYPSWVRLYNSIVADNSAAVSAADIRDGADAGSRRISAATYNLVESGTGNSITNGFDGNIVGSAPVLGPLQDNGGPTDTIMPGVGSPALQAIPRGSDPYYNDSPAEDQRGYWIDRPTDNPDYLNRTIGACWDGATATPARGFRGRIR